MIITLEYKNLSLDSGKNVLLLLLHDSAFIFLLYLKFRFTIKINDAEHQNVIVPRHNCILL